MTLGAHNGVLREIADDGRPFADAPFRHEPVQYVRIGLRERLGCGRRGPLEQQHGAVDRICEGAAEHEIAARDGLARVRKMIGTKGRSPFRVTVHDIVKEKIVAHLKMLFGSRTWTPTLGRSTSCVTATD